MRQRHRLWTDDDGSATIAAALAIAGLAALLLMVIYLGAAVLARHRAQHAADLAALAGAIAAVHGAANPCARARSIAAAQDGAPQVQRCTLDGQDLLVAVTVRVRLGAWGASEASAHARAGPAE
ncbi:MAG: Rv3654c family TadE-like protein [Gordonia sp. (in: high G+C Gram-positive bacteria)]|uniref:Rv3654c family TadE-like protein n=1 Tax=Gordonia sp. (in: high G+C Gram-positive bacteria) TaxID=84139 RepID=UPI003BB5DE33